MQYSVVICFCVPDGRVEGVDQLTYQIYLSSTLKRQYS
jgi:hypothetical protein